MKKFFFVFFLIAALSISSFGQNAFEVQYLDDAGNVVPTHSITRGGQDLKKVRLKITNPAGISIEKYVFTSVDGLYIQNQIAGNPNYSILTSESTPNKLTIQVVENAATSLNIDMKVWAGQCFPFSITEDNDKTQSNPFKMVQTSNNATAYLPTISIRKGAFLNYLHDESTRQALPNDEKIVTFSYVLENNSSVSFDGNISFQEASVGSVYNIRQINFYTLESTGWVLIPIDNSVININPKPNDNIGEHDNTFVTDHAITIPINLPKLKKIKIEEVVQLNGCLQTTGAAVNNSAPTIKWGNAEYDLCASLSTTTFIQYREFKPNIKCADIVGPNHFCFGDARAVKDRGVMREYKISNVPSSTFTTDVAKNVMIRLDGNADFLSPFNIPYVPNADNNNDNIFITVNGFKYIIDMDTYTIDYNALYSKTTTNPSFITNDQLEDWPMTGYVLFRARRTTAKVNGIFSLKDYMTKVQISPIQPEDYLYSVDCIGGFESKVIKGLAIDRFKLAGMDHINDPFMPIDIKPDDVVILHWREVNCCFDDQKMTQFNGIYSSSVSVSYETLCETVKIATVTPSVSRAAFTFIPSPSNPVTEGDADRCRSTSDGLVERISAKIEGGQLVTPGGYVSRQGRVVFRVYVQNGLDLDKALTVPRTSGWVAQAGYNNVTDNQLYVQNALSGCVGSTCAGNAAGDPCNLSNMILNPDYYVRLRPTKLGTQLNIAPRTIKLVASDKNVQETGQEPVDMTGPLKQELYFSNDSKYANQLYEIEFTVEDLLTFFAANRGSFPNSSPQNNLLAVLNQSELDIDLRAYCSINGKPSYQVIMYMDRCDGVTGPLSNTTCAAGYTTMEPITTFENTIMVNCPGCLIPGANIESSSLVRSVNSRGLVDADGDRRPDLPNKTLPAAHPTLKIAAMGDEMTATFTCYMSDGEDGVKGISKGTLDAAAVNNPNFYLDNFMVLGQFDGAITKDYVENPTATIPKIIPKNIEIKTVRMTYKGIERIYSAGNGLADHLFYPDKNSFLLRAKVKDFYDPTDITIPKSFGTGALDGINFELTYVIGDLGYDVKPVEVSYAPHYTPCDNCNDFTNMNLVNPADNTEVDFTELATVERYTDKTLWKCSGFSNRFKYIPYKQIASYGASDATCNKSVAVTMSGIFDAKRDVDYFQEEFRTFLHSDLKTEILIPFGYKPVSINITNKFLYNNREYVETFTIIEENKIATVHRPNTNSANNAMYPTLCAMSAQFEQMNGPIRFIAPLAQNTTFNNIFPDGTVQNLSRGDETFFVEFIVNFVKDASVQCSAIPEYKFWNAVNDVWSNIPMLYPNKANIPSFVAVPNNVNPQFRPAQANPNAGLLQTANYDVSSNGGQLILTKPVANLQMRNLGLLTLPPITTNRIQIPIEIANNKYNTWQTGQADFPYLQIYGDALTKGLTLVGVYRIDNSVTTPVFYPEIIRGDLKEKGIIIGIDYQNAGQRAVTRNPYLREGTNQYMLVFENSCPANCNQNVGCGTTNGLPNTCLVGNNNLHIGYGWNCNGYPTFKDLESKSTCGQYDPLAPAPIDPVITPTFKPLDYTVTVAEVGLTVNNRWINGDPIGNNSAMDILPCGAANTYTVKLSSCKEMGFNEYEIEFSGLSSGITITPKTRPTGDPIVVANDVNPAKPNLFHITTTSPSLLKGDAIIEFDITTTSCNIPNQTLTTIVRSKTFCTPTPQVNVTFNNPLKIKINPLTAISDQLTLLSSNIHVVNGNHLAVRYSLTGAGSGVSRFDNSILVKIVDGATSIYSGTIAIPAGTADGVIDKDIDLSINTCGNYTAILTPQVATVPSCGLDANGVIPACINQVSGTPVSKTVVLGTPLVASITTLDGYASFLCSSASKVTFVAYPQTAGLTYSWSGPGIVGPTNTNKIDAAAVGTYSVVVTNLCGSATATATVVNDLNVVCPQPICPGELPDIVVTNFNGVVGTYKSQWYNPSGSDGNTQADLEADILMDKGIFTSGYYYAATIIPSCTLRTNARTPQECQITVKRAPNAYHITSDRPSGDASVLFLCDGETTVLSVTDKSVNNAFPTDVIWRSGQTTTDDIVAPATWTNPGNLLTAQELSKSAYFIVAIDKETQCRTASNEISIETPIVTIVRTCDNGSGIKLTAVSNFNVTPDKYDWQLDGAPLAQGTNEVIASTAGVYTVVEKSTGCALTNRCWGIKENLNTHSTSNQELLSLQSGSFEGITATQVPLGFDTEFLPLDRTGYTGAPLPADYTIGKFMINESGLQASAWSPNVPSTWVNSNTTYTGTGAMFIDGESEPTPKLIWGQTIPVTHGLNYLYRFKVRNISLLSQYPVEEIPELYAQITYLDNAGNGTRYMTNKQALFNNGQTPWIEFSSYTSAIPVTLFDCLNPAEIQTVRLELFMDGGGSIGRDVAIDDVSLIPIGICDDVVALDLPCNAALAELDNNQLVICPGTTAAFNVINAPAGLTYQWQSVIGGTLTTVGSGASFVTPALNLTDPTKPAIFQYQVTITDPVNHCQTRESAKVIVSALPKLTITNSWTGSNCENKFVAVFDGLGTPSQFDWYLNGAFLVSGVTPVIYLAGNLKVNDIVQCKVNSVWCSGLLPVESNSIKIFDIGLQANAGPDKSVCAGGSVLIGSSENTDASYLWSPIINLNDAEKAQPLYTATEEGKYLYTLTLTDHITGCISEDAVEVSVYPTPQFTVTDPGSVCAPETVDITSAAVIQSSSSTLNYSFYSDAAATNVLVNSNALTTSGTYYIQATSIEGCKAIMPVVVEVKSEANVVVTHPAPVHSPITVDLTLPAITVGSTAGLVYNYYTDNAATTLLVTPNAVASSGTYYIKGTTTEGCFDIEPVEVSIEHVLSNQSTAGSMTVSLNPNPFFVQGYMTVSGASSNFVKATIIDMNGVVLFENANVLVNEPTAIGMDLPAAVYILKIMDGEKIKIMKFVKL